MEVKSSAPQSLKGPRVTDTSALPLSNQSIITPKHKGAKVEQTAGKRTSMQLLVTNKRPRVVSGGETYKKQSVPQTKNAVSPVTFLREMLKNSAVAAHRDASYDGSYFTKPNEKEIESYDLAVVDAIRARNVEQLRKFHREGKSLNASNRFGESLLHMCCRRGDTMLVRFLIEEIGVRINVKDDYGRTPLHDACWTPTPNFEIMDVIIKATDVSMLLAPDIRGHTPFDYARREHWAAWVKFFSDRKDMLLQQAQPIKVESS